MSAESSDEQACTARPHTCTPEWCAEDCQCPPGTCPQRDEQEPDWLNEQVARTRARLAALPEWARPTLRSNREQYDGPRGCTCGHPGAGCYCPLSNFHDTRTRPGQP